MRLSARTYNVDRAGITGGAVALHAWDAWLHTAKLNLHVSVSPLIARRPRLRVLVVHPNALIRRGLRAIIGDHADLTVVAEASEGCEAGRLVTALGSDGVDVALVDISARRAWDARFNELAIPTVLFSMSGLNRGPFRGVRVGIDGRLGEYVSPAGVAQALRQAHLAAPACS